MAPIVVCETVRVAQEQIICIHKLLLILAIVLMLAAAAIRILRERDAITARAAAGRGRARGRRGASCARRAWPTAAPSWRELSPLDARRLDSKTVLSSRLLLECARVPIDQSLMIGRPHRDRPSENVRLPWYRLAAGRVAPMLDDVAHQLGQEVAASAAGVVVRGGME